MQPFKPYFRGEEEPPSPRLTSCQKCFRTTDIENVGLTHRHLTFFEMLGNFSVGRLLQAARRGVGARAVHARASASTSSSIWITVFGGDEELGLGPDEEAIECWRAVGVPDERIVRLGPRGQLLAVRPDRSLRAVLGALPATAAPTSAPTDDRPGDDTERYLEFWNLVFMQYDLQADGSLTRLPTQNIDTGHGARPDGGDPPGRRRRSSRPTEFRPLIELGEELSGRRTARTTPPPGRCASSPTTAAAATFLLGRRRGALQRGPRLHPAPDHAPRDPAGPRARDRGEPSCRSWPSGSVDVHERRLSRARARVAHDRALGARRGGGLRPHARAGRAAAGRARARRPARSRPRGSPPRTPSSCTTPSASRTR